MFSYCFYVWRGEFVYCGFGFEGVDFRGREEVS